MLERGVVMCVCMHAYVEYRVSLCRQWKGRHSGVCDCDDSSGSMMSRRMCVCVSVCCSAVREVEGGTAGLVEDVRM